MPLHRRLPKLKGFSNARFKTTYQVVNTGRLAELYPQGGDVTPEDLAAKGAVRAGELVKVLGDGDAGGGAAGERARVLRLRPARRSPLPGAPPRSCERPARSGDWHDGRRAAQGPGRLPASWPVMRHCGWLSAVRRAG